MSGELDGNVAVVTGSSSGIGRAIAWELADAGAAVVVHARAHRQAAEETAAAIRQRGGQARVVVTDLAEPGNHEAFVAEAWDWQRGVDIWVNNAGADVLTGAAATASFEEKLEILWRVDVVATLRLSREIGRRMQQRDGAREAVILNMGWDQVEHGMAGDSGEMFSAIKGAVVAFSKSLAHSLAPRVRVNCLAPGWIKTAWGAHAPEYWQARACRESLLARWGTPEDVARVARFLASPAAAFITGHVVPINGGFRHGEVVKELGQAPRE